MNLPRALLFLVVTSTALAAEPALKAPKAGDLLGSCSVAAVSCTDFDKAVGPEAKAACVKYGLTWSDGACPTAKVVGTCVKKEGKGFGYTHSYPPGTAATAKQACTNTPGGAFVP
jgi:hypothetical protein